MTTAASVRAQTQRAGSASAPASIEVGFIGLGDQGLPMAVAVAEAGFGLHVWARRPESLERLGAVPATVHDSPEHLAAACDVVALCVRGDEDVLQLLSDGLLAGLRPGTVVVNHGTGTPGGAVRIADACAKADVLALDAPVSGGRAAAEAKALTVLIGGPSEAVERYAPVLATFAAHVVPMGGTGSGQTAKLFNNALLILNQAAIAELVELAAGTGTEPDRLVEALRLGSASSRAMQLLGEMVNCETVDHLSAVEDLDVDLFAAAMTESGLDAEAVVARAHAGARGLPALVARLPRTAAVRTAGAA